MIRQLGTSGFAARETLAFPDDYAAAMNSVLSGFHNYDGPVARAINVAEVVWQAVQGAPTAFRLPAGADAIDWFNQH